MALMYVKSKNSSTSSLYRDAKDIEYKYLMADEIDCLHGIKTKRK